MKSLHPCNRMRFFQPSTPRGAMVETLYDGGIAVSVQSNNHG